MLNVEGGGGVVRRSDRRRERLSGERGRVRGLGRRGDGEEEVVRARGGWVARAHHYSLEFALVCILTIYRDESDSGGKERKEEEE